MAAGDKLLVLPEDTEKELVEWLEDKLAQPAITYRTNIAGDSRWPVWRKKAATGDQWVDMEEPPDYAAYSANILMATVDTTKGIALQAPSVVEFVPVEVDDEEFCAELTAVIADYLWGARKARFKLGIAFLEGGIIGTAWSHTFWNEDLAGGDGDIDFDVLPADEVWVDPATPGPDRWGYIIHAARRPVLEVKYNDVRYNERRLEVASDQALTEGQKQDTPEEQFDLVTVAEYWIRGTYLKALIAEVDGVEQHVDETGLKYGVVITVAGSRVIRFVMHPWACERFPFQRFVYYSPDGNQRIWGHGEVEYLEDTQDAVNARMTQILNQAALIANNQWLVSTMVVVDDSELTNKPGQVVHVEGPPDMIQRIPPEGISGSLFNLMSLLFRIQEIISGMYEVNRGDIPGSLRAGVAIQALQRGGEGRTRQKMDNFDEFVADIGLGMADIMAVMYDEERTFRIVGSTEEALIQQVPGSQQPLAGFEAPEESVPTETSRPVKMSSERFKKDGKRVQLDARAQVGLQLRSTQEQLQQDIELLNSGVVDAQYVIENNRLRGKERLLARLMQVAQAQAGMQAPPEGAVPPVEGEMPVDEGLSPQEQEQMAQTVDMLLSQMQQLEEDGMVPPGTTAKVAQAVQNEIAQGGTGEVALAQAVQEIQASMGANGSAPGASGGPGVAAMPPQM
jgi:hypothetical protein